MAAAPLESSSILYFAASSIDPSRSHNELMADTDSQSTRKRPRLDSGNHLHESKSMSGCTPSSSEDKDRAVNGSLVVTSPSGSPEASALHRPSGRVTINMKSPIFPKESAQSAPQYGEAVDITGPDDSSAQVLHTSATTNAFHQSKDPTGIVTQPTTAISITSSPDQSPEIEVAEVEDMDQDPSTSNWRTLEDALRAPEEQDVVGIHEEVALADSFPRFRRNIDLREAVEELADMIEKG